MGKQATPPWPPYPDFAGILWIPAKSARQRFFQGKIRARGCRTRRRPRLEFEGKPSSALPKAFGEKLAISGRFPDGIGVFQRLRLRENTSGRTRCLQFFGISGRKTERECVSPERHHTRSTGGLTNPYRAGRISLRKSRWCHGQERVDGCADPRFCLQKMFKPPERVCHGSLGRNHAAMYADKAQRVGKRRCAQNGMRHLI